MAGVSCAGLLVCINVYHYIVPKHIGPRFPDNLFHPPIVRIEDAYILCDYNYVCTVFGLWSYR